MNAIVKGSALVGHFSEFFAPVDSGLIGSLIKQREDKRIAIESLHKLMNNEKVGSAMSYYIRAFNREKSLRGVLSGPVMEYDLEKAIATLDADYWEKALSLTDVKHHMNQDRRTEWWEMINECRCEPFVQETVINTIKTLLSDRARFMAEGVDGMFRRLSGSHVTNSPNGFNKRMIMNGVYDNRWSMPCSTKSGHVDDFRKIIAQFMGRDFRNGTTYGLISQMTRHYGKWVTWDGGSVRAKLFKKGTLHLEIHPDLAWRLNQILAYLHPMALTEGSLKKPTKPNKDFGHILMPVSFSVIEELQDLVRHKSGNEPLPVGLIRSNSPEVKKEIIEILHSIGGVTVPIDHVFSRGGEVHKIEAIEFDYNPLDVISHIIMSGCIPDKKSHQYYPTPKNLATELIDWSDIDHGDRVPEPSAGQGGLADLLPEPGLVSCVEISKLHCKILESKGFKTVNGDFMEFVDQPHVKFERIVMNPPFADGRAESHIKAAIKCLCDKGIITAILPATLKDKEIEGFEDFDVEWSDIRANEFADAGVRVVMMKAART